MIRIGVIGYGYWGPNIVRNLHGLSTTQTVMVCDKSPAALARVQQSLSRHPHNHRCSGAFALTGY